MAVSYSIKRRAEDAFTLLIKKMVGQDLSGFTYYKGLESTAQVAPRIHVLCRTLTPNVVGGRIIDERTCIIETAIHTQYIETSRDVHAKAQQAIECVYYHNGGTADNPTIVERINNLSIPNFQATIWTPTNEEEGLTDGRKEYMSIFTGELECYEDLI